MAWWSRLGWYLLSKGGVIDFPALRLGSGLRNAGGGGRKKLDERENGRNRMSTRIGVRERERKKWVGGSEEKEIGLLVARRSCSCTPKSLRPMAMISKGSFDVSEAGDQYTL